MLSDAPPAAVSARRASRSSCRARPPSVGSRSVRSHTGRSRSRRSSQQLRDQFGISAFRRPPTMPARSASVTGSPAPARCRRNAQLCRAITGRSVEEWSAARGIAWCRAATGPGLRHVIALVKSAAQSVRARTRATRRARRAKAWACNSPAASPEDNILAAYARSNVAGSATSLRATIRASSPAVAQSRHAPVLSGAGRCRHARGGRRLCGRIRKGGGACLVLRNEGSSG